MNVTVPTWLFAKPFRTPWIHGPNHRLFDSGTRIVYMEPLYTSIRTRFYHLGYWEFQGAPEIRSQLYLSVHFFGLTLPNGTLLPGISLAMREVDMDGSYRDVSFWSPSGGGYIPNRLFKPSKPWTDESIAELYNTMVYWRWHEERSYCPHLEALEALGFDLPVAIPCEICGFDPRHHWYFERMHPKTLRYFDRLNNLAATLIHDEALSATLDSLIKG